jgi:hypothetical protein
MDLAKSKDKEGVDLYIYIHLIKIKKKSWSITDNITLCVDWVQRQKKMVTISIDLLPERVKKIWVSHKTMLL